MMLSDAIKGMERDRVRILEVDRKLHTSKLRLVGDMSGREASDRFGGREVLERIPNPVNGRTVITVERREKR